MKFTDRKLFGLKPKASVYEIREQDGFVLRIYPSGKKVFQFVYDAGGKRRRVSIGEYPTVLSLAEAREKHAEMYRAVKRGENPISTKALTIRDLAEKFLKEYVARNNSQRVIEQRRTQFDKDVFPLIGSQVTAEVTRSDILRCLKRHADAGTATGHNHLLGTIKKMFNWAIEQELCENNPAHLVKLMKTSPRNALVSDADTRLILQSDDRDSAKILQLCLYTCCRPGEAQNICYEDISDGWWTCEQRKGGVITIKRTPLVPAAMELIGEGSGRVFSLAQQNGLAQYVMRKYKGRFQPRDIRRTVATSLRKMGYSRELVSALLGHSAGILQETYQLYQYDREKMEMLLKWEESLLRIKKKDQQ